MTFSSIPGNSAGRCSKHCGCQDREGWIWGQRQLAQPEAFVRLTNGYLHVTSLEHDTCICLDKPRVWVPGCLLFTRLPHQGSPSRWSPALSSSSPPSTPPGTEGYKDNIDFQSLLPDISSPHAMIINNPFLVNKKKKITDSWVVLKHSSVT